MKDMHDKNNKKLIRLLKTFMFAFVFSICTLSSFSKVYADRYKYTFEMTNGDKYIVIADMDSNGNITYVSRPLINMSSVLFGNYLGGSSLYNIVATDYEHGYNYNESFSETSLKQTYQTAMENRAKDLAALLELYCEGQKGEDGYIYTRILFDSNVVISATGSDHTWQSNGKNSYYDIIVTNCNSRKKTNPYYIDDQIKNSDKVGVNDRLLSDVYTDEELIKAYEHSPARSSLRWINREPASSSELTTSGYSYEIRKLRDFIVLDLYDRSRILVDEFIIAEVDSNNKASELVYFNTLDVKFTSKVTGFGLTTDTSGTNSKGVDDNTLLYYYLRGSSKITINTYKDSSGNLFISPRAYVAVRNSVTGCIDIFEIDTSGNGTKVASCPLLDSFEAQGIGDITKITAHDDNWEVARDGSTLTVRNANLSGDDDTYYLDLSKAYLCYNDSDYYYDVAIPTKKGINGPYTYTDNDGNVNAYITLLKSDQKINKDGDDAIDSYRPFKNALNDSCIQIYMRMHKMVGSIGSYGTSKSDVMFVKDGTYKRLKDSDDDSTIPPELPINEFLCEPTVREMLLDGISDSLGEVGIAADAFYGNLLTDKSDMTIEFVSKVIGYGKIVLILLIFIGILIAGFKHMIDGVSDPVKRAQTISAFKSIAVVAIVFVTMTGIIAMVIHYLNQGFDLFDKYDQDQFNAFFEDVDEEASIRQGALMDFLEFVLNIINEVYEGLIEILAKTCNAGEGIDYIKAIYDVYTPDGNVSIYKPFDDGGIEWTRLIQGYNAMAGVSMILLIIVVIKTAIEYIIYAGNEKQILKIKESWFRMFWAVILLLTVPYLIQLLLYLFNYMVAIVPVDYQGARFDIQIKFNGILGAIGRNIFLQSKFDIFFALLVRHVMIAVLFVSAPIVIVLWAISEKFKSFPMWFGELITNIAMQFCYAVGFTALILLSYESQNPFYGLVLVTVSLALSKFIKESLQGYFKGGAGINEEAEGQKLNKKMQGWGKRFTRGIKKTGKVMEQASKKIDSEQKTGGGKFFTNMGKAMQGKFLDIHISSGKGNSGRKMYDEINKTKGTKEYDALNQYQEEWDKYYKAKEEAEKNGEEFDAEGLMPEREEGGVFDTINQYYDGLSSKSGSIGEKWAKRKERMEESTFQKEFKKKYADSDYLDDDDYDFNDDFENDDEEDDGNFAEDVDDSDDVEDDVEDVDDSDDGDVKPDSFDQNLGDFIETRTDALNSLGGVSQDEVDETIQAEEELIEGMAANQEGGMEAVAEMVDEHIAKGRIQAQAMQDQLQYEIAQTVLKDYAMMSGAFQRSMNQATVDTCKKLMGDLMVKELGKQQSEDMQAVFRQAMENYMDKRATYIHDGTSKVVTSTSKKK